ncbi:pyridoxamine 5'-phosphate oxidase family protein [Nereida sp. MMG025]|uniref:pyridoxamine 5'-phosphate oxidase family protein n=1 Tax=Nereida sp. MMG025 TaxID=2909981 RepID=UPI001F3C1802|nr:pyridoxamine 5'-phosphate oxidase family protein [Nereida sp. MMG025]MCF6444341.1 pyridoxamine 5'-phosphate oxidase family protein [Nereida sp. MMG025]
MTHTSIRSVEDLEAIYGAPAEASLLKVADHLTPLYRAWVMASKFCVVATVGDEGTDASPRGDAGPVVSELDPKTLLMPDWRGNNRIDTLRNIVRDGRISLMFMVPPSNNVVRVNGMAVVSQDQDLIERFEQAGKHPRTVIVITIGEIYTQCARALMRSALWSPAEMPDLPSIGEIVKEQKASFDAKSYDEGWAARAKDTMW